MRRPWMVAALALLLPAQLALGADGPVKEQVDAIVGAVMEKGSVPAARRHAGSAATVVGVVTRDGMHIYCYGRLRADSDSSPPPNAQTIFEIGSVSKVFTGILLADMIDRGDVRAGDTVHTCLPAGTRVPTRGGKEVTLEHLATHSSGLPRIPLIILFKDDDDPYAREDAKRLYAVLDGIVLLSDPGQESSYSNLGFALLGQALVEKSEKDYEALVVQRICEPLGLADTRITLSDQQKQRLAPGHREGEVVPNWTFQAYAPAGAIRSSASDMCRFLRANLEPDGSAMSKVLREARRPRRQMDDSRIGFGWLTTSLGDGKGEAVWHNGGTGGYAAFIGLVESASVGVVVLMNWVSAADEGAETALGFALLSRLVELRTRISPSSATAPADR